MTNTDYSAFIDESMTSSSDFYVLTALVIPDSDVNQTRRAIQSVAPVGRDGKRYFHSNRARDSDREELLNTLFQSSSTSSFVTSVAIQFDASQEEARQSCLAEFLVHGSQIGVTSYTLDSRLDTRRNVTDPNAKNRQDRKTMYKLKSLGLIAPQATMHHADDRLEPMIWAADCVAWIVRRSLASGDVGQTPHFVHRLNMIEARREWSQLLDDPRKTGPAKAKTGGSQSSNQTRPSMSPGGTNTSWPGDLVGLSSQKHKETSIANQAIIDNFLAKCRAVRAAKLPHPPPATSPDPEVLPPLGGSHQGSRPPNGPGL